METVFGPVPSRRLGQSLGIDPVPMKACNWNCVYCQLGRTRQMVTERQSFVPEADILAEVAAMLARHTPGEIDWITFIGSGETTLHKGLGKMIRAVKKMTDIPVAVITNGATLYLREIRQELLPADAVLPSLDAGNPDLYRRINRPHPEITFERLVSGLKAFRQAYQGRLWIEVMLVQGLNDTEPALIELAGLLKEINPDEVHLMQPTRPPAETWVRPPDADGLVRAQAILGKMAQVIAPASGSFDLSGEADPLTAILHIIQRHPMRESELVHTLRQNGRDVEATLKALGDSEKARRLIRYDIPFWAAQDTHFAQEN